VLRALAPAPKVQCAENVVAMSRSLSQSLHSVVAYVSREFLPGIQKWGVVFGGLLAVQGFSALTQVYLARRISPEQYAVYLASSSLTSMLVVLPSLGVETWLLVSPSHRKREFAGRWHAASLLLAKALSIWLVGTLGLAVFLPQDRYPIGVVFLLAVGLAIERLLFLNYAAFRAVGKHLSVALLQIITSVGLFVFVLSLPSTFDQVQSLVVARLVLVGGGLILSTILAKPHISTKPRRAIAPKLVLRQCWPFLLSDLAVAVYLKSDLTVVTLLLGKSAAAEYGPALSLVNLTFIVPNAMFLLVMPRLSNLHSANRERYWGFAWFQLGLQIVLGIGLGLVVRFLAPPLIDLSFGPSYAPSIEILRQLSLVPVLKSLNFGLAAVLITVQHQKKRTWVQLACAVFNVAANLVVVFLYGLPGVAGVHVISELLLSAGYGYLVLRAFSDKKLEVFS